MTMLTLVVINPFDGRKTGDTITDAAEIESILTRGHAQDVVPSDHETAKAATPKPNIKKES
jgi:hypothetical protein